MAEAKAKTKEAGTRSPSKATKPGSPLCITLSHLALGYPTSYRGLAIAKLKPVLQACKCKGAESESGIMFLPQDRKNSPHIELADTGQTRHGDMVWEACPEKKEFALPTRNAKLFEKLFELLGLKLQHGGYGIRFIEADEKSSSAKFHFGFHLDDSAQVLTLRDLMRNSGEPAFESLADVLVKLRDGRSKRALGSGEFRAPFGNGDEIEFTYGTYGLEGHMMAPKRPCPPIKFEPTSPWCPNSKAACRKWSSS